MKQENLRLRVIDALFAAIMLFLSVGASSLSAFEVYVSGQKLSAPGDELQVTLALRDVDPISPVMIESLDFTFSFDSNALAYNSVSVGPDLLATTPPPFSAFNLIAGTTVIGTIAVISPVEAYEDIVIATIRFDVLPSIGENTIIIDLSEVITNEEFEQVSPGLDENDGVVFVPLEEDDTDGDGVPDSVDSDIDGDNLPNEFEADNGLNPFVALDALEDLDQDGLTNYEEYVLGTSISKSDSDGDGSSDFDEVSAGASPLNSQEYIETTVVALQSGFNLVALPMRADLGLNVLVNGVAQAEDILEVQQYDETTRRAISLAVDQVAQSSISAGEALVVYMNASATVEFPVKTCVERLLSPGPNFIGFNCRSGMASEFMNEDTSVVSIQRFDPNTARFEILLRTEINELLGEDFPLTSGEGFIVYVR